MENTCPDNGVYGIARRGLGGYGTTGHRPDGQHWADRNARRCFHRDGWKWATLVGRGTRCRRRCGCDRGRPATPGRSADWQHRPDRFYGHTGTVNGVIVQYRQRRVHHFNAVMWCNAFFTLLADAARARGQLIATRQLYPALLVDRLLQTRQRKAVPVLLRSPLLPIPCVLLVQVRRVERSACG